MLRARPYQLEAHWPVSYDNAFRQYKYVVTQRRDPDLDPDPNTDPHPHPVTQMSIDKGATSRDASVCALSYRSGVEWLQFYVGTSTARIYDDL